MEALSPPSALQKLLLAAIPLIIGLGLLVDQFAGAWGQPAVSCIAWLAFAFIVKSESSETRLALLLCLGLATFGEVVLSLVWGLYDYRLHNIPLFVPPGHVLLFWFGMRTVRWVPGRALDAVALLTGVVTLSLAVTRYDWLSVPLWLMFATCWTFGSGRRFYTWMLLLALAMEVYATLLGNWAWRALVPGLGWPTLNPPLAAGGFYCVLDVCVLTVCAAWARYRAAPVSVAASR